MAPGCQPLLMGSSLTACFLLALLPTPAHLLSSFNQLCEEMGPRPPHAISFGCLQPFPALGVGAAWLGQTCASHSGAGFRVGA